MSYLDPKIYTQHVNEDQYHVFDFSLVMLTGGSVTGGTARVVRPNGGTVALTDVVAVSPYIYASLPASALTEVGEYRLWCRATTDNTGTLSNEALVMERLVRVD